MSFGIFQEYYSDLPEFAGSPYITYVGSIATGIVYLGAPLLAPLVKRFPVHQSHMVWLGWMICIAALIAGSFANTVGALIVTQGIMYGSKCLASVCIIFDEDFYADIVQLAISSYFTRSSVSSMNGGSHDAVWHGAFYSHRPVHLESHTHSSTRLCCTSTATRRLCEL